MQTKSYLKYTLNFKLISFHLLAYLFSGLFTFSVANASKLAVSAKFGSYEELVLFVLDLLLVILSATIAALLTRGDIEDYLEYREEHIYLNYRDRKDMFKSLMYKSIFLYIFLATPTLWIIYKIIYWLI